MITKREIPIIALIIAVISFSVALSSDLIGNWMIIFTILATVSLVILLNVFTKKIIAYFLDSEIEMKIWETTLPLPFGKKLRNFPLGGALPLLSKIVLFPFKSFVWMGSLVFDVKPRTFRAAKRFGLYTFSDVTEYHLGLIAASGILINLILSAIGYFAGFPLFARLNMYYAFFNILPLSELDGNKIFFGSKIMWSFLASLVLIGMLFAIFIV
jgi:hypothetical protein